MQGAKITLSIQLLFNVAQKAMRYFRQGADVANKLLELGGYPTSKQQGRWEVSFQAGITYDIRTTS